MSQHDTAMWNVCALVQKVTSVLADCHDVTGKHKEKVHENLNLCGPSGQRHGEALGFWVCVGGDSSQEQEALLTLEEPARCDTVPCTHGVLSWNGRPKPWGGGTPGAQRGMGAWGLSSQTPRFSVTQNKHEERGRKSVSHGWGRRAGGPVDRSSRPDPSGSPGRSLGTQPLDADACL